MDFELLQMPDKSGRLQFDKTLMAVTIFALNAVEKRLLDGNAISSSFKREFTETTHALTTGRITQVTAILKHIFKQNLSSIRALLTQIKGMYGEFNKKPDMVWADPGDMVPHVKQPRGYYREEFPSSSSARNSGSAFLNRGHGLRINLNAPPQARVLRAQPGYYPDPRSMFPKNKSPHAFGGTRKLRRQRRQRRNRRRFTYRGG